jgi:hypothetical protein
MNSIKSACLFVFVCCLQLAAFAQEEGKIRGFVYDKSNSEPVAFSNIVVKGTGIGAVASEEGYFVLNDVPAGEQVLQISFVGYETKEQTVEVKADRIVAVKVYIAQASEMLDDVVVNAERQARETKVLTSVVSLDPKEIQRFSVGGDADIVKAIQVLPGVVTTGDQGGQLYIRGGAPIQNLILLDGMILYNPFHSIGFFSVFDADIVRSADVYSGGFSAEYGSRNSAVMDIQTRDGNRKKFSGKVSASTYMAKALIETPIGKPNENGLASSSFLVSAKTSYLNQSSDIFYPYIETEFDGLPFTFTDIYAKLSSQSSNGSRVNVFGFSFDDAVSFGGNNSINWQNVGAGADFTAIPPSSAVLLEGDISYSRYEITAIENGETPRNSSITSFNGGLDFTYFLSKNNEFKYGIEAIGYATSFDAGGTSVDIIEDNTTELGGYGKYKYSYSNRLIIEPSLRLHYYSSLSELSFEPRIGLKYNITSEIRFKGSAGLYSQNLVAANSDRDVVNLFYGFLSGPENVNSSFRGEELTSRLQKAAHYVVGFEFELSKNLTANLEAYLKDFSQITNANRNKLYLNEAAAPEGTDPILYEDFITERGSARGIDLLLKYNKGNLNLWGVYSISKVSRDDGIIVYAPQFDRRHNLNLVGSYSFGKDDSWEVSTRYNFGTGFPFTPTQLFYSEQLFVDENGRADLEYDYTRENGELGVAYGELNSNRLPNYHRVDVSIMKNFKLGKYQKLEVSAGATNMLNYQNIFYYDRVENKRVDQLPIMPTISFAYSF